MVMWFVMFLVTLACPRRGLVVKAWPQVNMGSGYVVIWLCGDIRRGPHMMM